MSASASLPALPFRAEGVRRVLLGVMRALLGTRVAGTAMPRSSATSETSAVRSTPSESPPPARSSPRSPRRSGGKLGDLIGGKPVHLASIAVFTV
ncbi:hypothetical protein ACIQJT_32520 [Streptomyces sp. NPDC091972]|uniref:hypothetical protein n=1 Tax=Streptomyces sp. NPDC091972 TaxID=3366007 RepID=UPI0037FC96A9